MSFPFELRFGWDRAMTKRTSMSVESSSAAGTRRIAIDTSIDETNCPVKFTIDLIGGKWKPLILYYLKGGPVRFGALRRLIPNASHKVLTQKLRELERDRIIVRTVLDAKVKHVEYSYSEYGRTLVPILGALAGWEMNYRNKVDISQQDRTPSPRSRTGHAVTR
jgi:DNA-binding HxlR family transcriptional regulator